MEEIRHLLRNPFVKKLDQSMRRNGYDENFITQSTFHFRVCNKHMNDCMKNGSSEEISNLFLSKLFMDKVNFYSAKRLQCQINENSDWPVPLQPSEVFQETKLPDIYRKYAFFSCLNKADILDCRVETIYPFEYYFKIIHKFGTTRKLDDLNLMVVMPRNEIHLNILKNELRTCELVRVAVSAIDKEGEICVYGTVDESVIKNSGLGKVVTTLGRISEDDLPPYVLNPPDLKKCSSYASYLNSMPQFQIPSALNEIFIGFGIDSQMVYSYYPQLDRSKCSNDLSSETLLKESESRDIKKYAQLAINKCIENNFDEAFDNIDKAFKICSKNEELLFSLYDIRATIHKSAEKLKFSKYALKDWMKAHFLNRSDERVKKCLSKCLFKVANIYYHKGEYKKACIHAEYALRYDEMNRAASSLLEYLKSDDSEDLSDKKSPVPLQERKKRVRRKLKTSKRKIADP